MKKIAVIPFAIFAFISSGYAFTANDGAKKIVSNGSLSDTQAAVNYVAGKAQDGWVLTVGAPGGSYTWTEVLNINIPHVFTVQGASPSERPTITSTHTGGFGVIVNGRAGKVITIKDLRIPTNGWASINALFLIQGSGECFRLTNLYVSNPNDRGFAWISSPSSTGGSGPFGLIDHCQFEGYTALFIRQNTDSPDAEWPNNHTVTWGTRDAVFIEDCTYIGSLTGTNGFTNDGNQAGKVVIRHNDLTNTAVAWHGRDSGGTSVAYKHGFLSGEVYENTFNVTRAMLSPLIMIRSGTALVHDNALNISSGGSVATGAQLQTHCAGGAFAAEGCRSCSNGSVMSQALQYPRDYPDCQQPGTPQPVRVWSNTNSTSMAYGWASGDSAFTQVNREYYVSDNDSVKPAGYVPFTYPHPLNTGGTPSAPTNNTVPQISGVTTQGQSLTGTPGSWSGFPVPTKTYQWVACDESGRDCVNISGATTPTYTLQAAQVDKRIKLTVTATNSQGDASASSTLTDIVAAPGTENLLINPGFETRTGAVDNNNNDAAWTGWIATNGAGYVRSSTAAHSGNYSWNVFRGWTHPSNVMSVRQTVPVTPGLTYTFAFWSKNTASERPRYFVLDASHGDAPIINLQNGPSSTSWVKTETTFRAPAGTTLVTVGFEAANLGGAQSIWIDDVVVVPRIAAPLNLRASDP